MLFRRLLLMIAMGLPCLALQVQTPTPKLAFSLSPHDLQTWIAHGGKYSVTISPTGAAVYFPEETLTIQLAGANPGAAVSPKEPQPGRINYLIGPDPNRWINDAPTFARLQYAEVYPHTALAWYGKDGSLEYDLVLSPHADPGSIRLKLAGARKVSIVNNSVRVDMSEGQLTLQAPVVYQESDGKRQDIRCEYVLLSKNEVGFRIHHYDPSRSLTIDPVIVFGTYFGAATYTPHIGTDASGNVYLAANTSYIPVTQDAQTGFTGRRHIGVSKFDPNGILVYSTYVGDDSNDQLFAMAVGVDGTVGLTGSTTQPGNFPFTQAPTEPTDGAPTGFLMKLNAAGNGFSFVVQSLAYQAALALDSSGNSYISGNAITQPTAGAYGAGGAFFVSKYSPSGILQYTATLPFAVDSIGGLAAEGQGALFIAGDATGQNFGLPFFPNSPTGAHAGSGADSTYWFISKLSPDGSHLLWSSFLGLGSSDPNSSYISAITQDPVSSTLYVTGPVTSTNVPTTSGAWQTTVDPTSASNGLLAALSADGSSFSGITYLNGASPLGLAPTPTGIVVDGVLDAKSWPTVRAVQPAPPFPLVNLFSSSDAGATWSSLNAAPLDGYGLWIDPQNRSILLDLTSTSIFRSADAGVSWSKTFDGLTAFAASPDGGSLYAATQAGSHAFLKSTDAGATWQLVGQYSDEYGISGLSINPKNPLDIVGVGPTVSQSLDGGQSFVQIDSQSLDFPAGPFSTFTDSAGNILMLAQSGHFYRSTNRGQSWSAVGTSILCFAAAVQAPSSLSTVYSTDGAGTSLFKSSDLGATWIKVNSIQVYSAALAVSPDDANTLWISTPANDEILRSTDGGATLTRIGEDPQAIDPAALSVDSSGRLYLVNRPASVGFVAKLDGALSTPVWSSFFGSESFSFPSSAAPAPRSSDVWIAGVSGGPLPLTTPQSPLVAGSFVARISDATPPCSYSLSHHSQYIYHQHLFSAAITAPSGCPWSASSDSSWITVKYGANGTGSGVVTALASANTTNKTRTCHLTVADQQLNITQPPSSCTFTVPPIVDAPANGGAVQIPVTTQPGCGWDAESNGAGLKVTSATTNMGTGTVTVSVPAPTLAAPQSDIVYIAGQPISIAPTLALGTALQFVPATPCRVADTRQGNSAFGGPIIIGQTSRDFTITESRCSIPSTAAAYSLNVTAVPPGPLAYLTIWTTGQPRPQVSTLNSVDGRVKAAAAIIAPNSAGSISIFASNDTHVVLDINGYFVPVGTPNALAYYPLTPCRVADTRSSNYGTLGAPSFANGEGRDLPILSSHCGIPSNAQAYAMNFTVIPKTTLAYLTVWPSGTSQPGVSTVNALSGQVTANAAIVAAGTNGDIDVLASNATDVVIDVNGYFAPPATGGLSLHTTTPCRVFDGRQDNGSPLTSTAAVNMANPACEAPASAQAYVANATVIPSGPLGYLTLWPQGGTQPTVSTLNAMDGVVTSNLAIVQATNGVISAFPSNPAHLVLDLFGYFSQ